MQLNDNQKKWLNDKCIKAWGLTFDQVYNAIDQNHQLKEELKKQMKEKKKIQKFNLKNLEKE